MSVYGGTATKKLGQRFAAALAGGSVPHFVEFAVGDGNGVVPALSDQGLGLVHETWRGLVQSYGLNPSNSSQLDVYCMIPDSAGALNIREIGLFDENADQVWAGVCNLIKPSAEEGVPANFSFVIEIPVASGVAVPLSTTTEDFATIAYVDATFASLQIEIPGADRGVTYDTQGNKYRGVIAQPDAVGVGRPATDNEVASGAAAVGALTSKPWVTPQQLKAIREAIESEIPAVPPPPDLSPYLLITNQRGASRGVVVEADQYKGVIATTTALGVSRELTAAERVAKAIANGSLTANPYLGLEALIAIEEQIAALASVSPTVYDYTITPGVAQWLSDDLSAFRRVEVVIDGVKGSWGGTYADPGHDVICDFAESPTTNYDAVYGAPAPDICRLFAEVYNNSDAGITATPGYGGAAFALVKGFFSVNGDAGAARWALINENRLFAGPGDAWGIIRTVGTRLRLRTLNASGNPWVASGTFAAGHIRLTCWK